MGNSCAGTLATSLAEGTVVLWPGHLEMNYEDSRGSEADGSLLGHGEGETGSKQVGSLRDWMLP